MNPESKTYELGYLLGSAEAETEVLAILKRHQVKVINHGPLADTKLTYPIKKQQAVRFGFVQFEAAPEGADAIKKEVGLQKSVLRSIMLNIAAKTLKAKEASASRAPRPTGTTSPSRPLPASAPASVPTAKPQILSNEALSEKLEEILK